MWAKEIHASVSQHITAFCLQDLMKLTFKTYNNLWVHSWDPEITSLVLGFYLDEKLNHCFTTGKWSENIPLLEARITTIAQLGNPWHSLLCTHRDPDTCFFWIFSTQLGTKLVLASVSTEIQSVAGTALANHYNLQHSVFWRQQDLWNGDPVQCFGNTRYLSVELCEHHESSSL